MAGDAAAAATAGDGQGQQDAAQQGGVDTSAIDARFAEVTGGMDDLRTLVQQVAQHVVPQQDEGVGQEPEPEPLDLSEFLDPDGTQDPQQVAQRLQEAIQQQIQNGLQQQLSQQVQPLQESLNEMRMEAEAERLVAEFPVLGENPEAAQQVIQAAQQVVQANGWPAGLGSDPRFWRYITLSGIGARALNDEGQQEPEDSGVATLEGAAGAMPGGGSGAMSGERILGAGPRRVTPF